MRLASNDSVSEFQSRRLETWRIIRPWIFVTAAAFFVFAVVVEFYDRFPELWRLNLIFGGFLVAAVSIIRINLTINKLYRCPACNSVPMGRKGVFVNPDTCPQCWTRLN
jgi:hypothetical protein